MWKKRLRWALGIAGGVLVLVLGFAGAIAYYHYVWAGETENVSFASGDLAIAGLLVKPSGEGPHPAIVFLHGSGRADGRHGLPDYRVHANVFVRRGFSVLVYDKRGTGQSGGDFSTATYDDFVQDAVAAVEFLRSRQDIDPHRIGLLGTSEGGWLAPKVAQAAGDMAFIINKCGPPLSWQDTVLFEIENELKGEDLSPDVIQEELELWARMWQYYEDAARDPTLATGAERDAINAQLAALAERVDRQKLGLPAELEKYEPQRYAQIAADVSYDSTEALRELDLPMLWVFGENDVNVPTTRSVAVLEQLKNERKRDITIKVYPGVGHSLMSWSGITSAGYVGGYLELIGSWAEDHADRQE